MFVFECWILHFYADCQEMLRFKFTHNSAFQGFGLTSEILKETQSKKKFTGPSDRDGMKNTLTAIFIQFVV